MTYLFTNDQEIKNELGNPISISKNTNINSSNNRIYVDTGVITTITDSSVGTFYGEPYAIPITPIVQLSGVYGVDPLDTQVYTGSGGSVNSTLSCYDIATSATVGSYAVLRSRRFNTFRAGESLLVRGYLRFDDPIPLFTQRWGIQNQENAFYIGYNGNSFGILQTNKGKVPLYKVTVSSYTGTQTVTLTLNGVPYTISIVTGESINLAAHRISDDSGTNFNNLWMTTQRGNTVEFLYTGPLAPLPGTFSITSTGNLVAAITTMQAGVAATDTWIYTTDAGGPVLPTNIDPTAFQQYQIKYNCAGVSFFVLSPTSIPRYVLIYTHLNIAGNVTQPEISNPAFKVSAMTFSLGSTTAKSLFVNNMSMHIEGVLARIKYSRGAGTTQAALAKDDLHHIISVQNSLTYNNTINTIELLLQDISCAMQCGDPVEVYLFLDAPLLTGRHDFQNTLGFVAGISKVTGTIDINTNEPLAVMIAGQTGSQAQFDLTQYRSIVPPGSYITIAVHSTSAIARASVATVWYAE